MSSNSSLDVQVTSTTNVFPSHPKDQPISTSLSIFDNASANLNLCAAIWFFSPPTGSVVPLSPSHFQETLSQTLNSYRQWCGRLSHNPPSAITGHTKGFGRLWATYNTPSDLGISFLLAESSKTLSDYLPNTSGRTSTMKIWNAHELCSSELLPTTGLAISTDTEAPNMIIQFTQFACGSTAIGIKLPHCLSDAMSMCQFAKDWARTSKAMINGDGPQTLTPVFNPQLLDSCAAGDIDAAEPDFEIQGKARELPQHRYDWYKPADEKPRPLVDLDSDTVPDFDVPATSVQWDTTQLRLPAGIDPIMVVSPSIPIPYYQWDTTAPNSLRVLHFSAQEVITIFSLINSSSQSTTPITKHDALLAHVWSRINASRQLPPGTTTYLHMTFGLRARTSPPLPNAFIGSPISHAAIASVIPYPSSPNTQNPSTLAQNIRNTLSLFTPDAVATILHDKAFEPFPTRLWTCCPGREHIIPTSWIHAGAYDVDFTGGETGRPCYVDALMPDVDGLVEIMEAPGAERYKEGGSWWSDGVDISIHLEATVMERLIADQSLFSV